MKHDLVLQENLHQQESLLYKPEMEIAYKLLCSKIASSSGLQQGNEDTEMIDCLTNLRDDVTIVDDVITPDAAGEKFMGNSSTVTIDSGSWPTSTPGLEEITHGPVWTPDVVQLVATIVPIMAVTLLGNVVIIVVLTCSKHRKINTRVNIFIVNLAIGDLSVLCCTMTTEVSPIRLILQYFN